MINIRHQVFETNSSSTHSISITSSAYGILETLPCKEGIVYLTGGEFGWEWKKYNDALTKANYAAVFANGNPGMTDMLVSVIKEHTGAKDVKFNLSDSLIDHQSSRLENGDALRAFNSPDSLKDWIFNPESWLFTGNDNEEDPPNFYDVDFGIDYTHQISLEGCDVVEKFESYPTKEQIKDSLKRIAFQHPSCKQYPKSFEIIDYPLFSAGHVLISSFDEMDNNFIKLFRIRPAKMIKDEEFQGYEIYKLLRLQFTIAEI
jgi:hypothetical protein